MVQIRRAIIVQVGGLFVVAIILFFLSRLFPVVDILAAIQHRVMQWGAWSAICYPLLYACCNVLLLPGGVLSIGAGFFFGLWWGFLIALVGNVVGAAISFFISRWIGRAMAEAEAAAKSDAGGVGTCGRERRVEDHPSQPASSSFSNESDELSLRLDPDSVSNVHALGRDRTGARACFSTLILGTLGQLGLNLARGKTHPRAIEYLVWLGGFASAAIILVLLGRIALRLLQDAERDATGKAAVRVEPTLEVTTQDFRG